MDISTSVCMVNFSESSFKVFNLFRSGSVESHISFLLEKPTDNLPFLYLPDVKLPFFWLQQNITSGYRLLHETFSTFGLLEVVKPKYPLFTSTDRPRVKTEETIDRNTGTHPPNWTDSQGSQYFYPY